MAVQLMVIDEGLLPRLLAVAVADANPEDVMAPVPGEEGWTPVRRAAFVAYHRGCRPDAAETTYAVVADGAVVGAARLAIQPSPEALEVGVWLGRSSRGQGFGAAVLPVAADLAQQRGARRLVARTTAGNVAAVRALTAHGFQLTSDADGTVTGTLPLGPVRR